MHTKRPTPFMRNDLLDKGMAKGKPAKELQIDVYVWYVDKQAAE